MNPSPLSRQLLGDAVQTQGPAWRNAADSIRAGNACNVWIVAALAAIDTALTIGPRDSDETEIEP